MQHLMLALAILLLTVIMGKGRFETIEVKSPVLTQMEKVQVKQENIATDEEDTDSEFLILSYGECW